MALLDPSLLAAVADNSHPRWRGTSLGIYGMWRDSGYAFGALLIGVISDAFGYKSGFYFTAVVMFVSGAIVAVYMYETAHPAGRWSLFGRRIPHSCRLDGAHEANPTKQIPLNEAAGSGYTSPSPRAIAS